MYNLNYDFFDEFKKLDKLCKEIYRDDSSNKLGVTLYIEDMEKHSYSGQQKVRSWRDDYYKLKHIRHIRNELAHSDISFSSGICTESDLQFTRDFYQRLLARTDPISNLLGGHRRSPWNNNTHNENNKRYTPRPYIKIRRRYSSLGCFTLVLWVVFVIILACILLITI